MISRCFSIQLILLLGTLLTVACDPTNKPRWTHEPAQEWKTSITPDKEDIPDAAFQAFDLRQASNWLKAGHGDMMKQILLPLSNFVLNHKFIDKPANRGDRMAQMISLFNMALVKEWSNTTHSSDFEKLKQDYLSTVFAGCSRDLKINCVNAGLFAADGRHTMIMTRFAKELDPQLDEQITAAGKSQDACISAEDPTCRHLIEQRYRLLAMGLYKRNRNQEPDFAFAYLKYGRMFNLYLNQLKDPKFKEAEKQRAKKDPKHIDETSQGMSLSYLSDVHTQIFEMIISKYEAVNHESPEFCQFVDNAAPWFYSHKDPALFQAGISSLFRLASQYCLYQDPNKTVLSPSIVRSIKQSQEEDDSFGLSFKHMVLDITHDYDEKVRKTEPDVLKAEAQIRVHTDQYFSKLGLVDLVHSVKADDPAFFNEFFFIVDRLFRGHLNVTDIELMLSNVNRDRARRELPTMISKYIKLYMADLVVQTNRFMAGIYASNISSDQIFEQAVVHSREITTKWYTMQAQIGLLDSVEKNYFKSQLASSDEFNEANKLLLAVNRNIHYVAIYPNMIVMNYFLSKMKGQISIETWWGKIDFPAETILQDFLDGKVTEPWFRFANDAESLDRLMLLYGLQYMLTTESMDYFVARDATNIDGTDKSKFFDLIFSKYLGDTMDSMRKELSDYNLATLGDPNFALTHDVCQYELGATANPRQIPLDFTHLGEFTYTGLGNNSVNRTLNMFLTGGGHAAGRDANSEESMDDSQVSEYLNRIESRRTYVMAMIDVIRASSDPIDVEPNIKKANEMLGALNDVQSQLMRMFTGNHETYFACAMRLREVERRRANRLYDEEKAHLEHIYDLMAASFPADATPEQIKAAGERLNSSEFTTANGYTFDHIDGKNYILSKYDLFMRIKKNLESDIFYSSPTEKERRYYGQSLNQYLKPRPVTVYVPRGIERDDMYAKGTSISITIHLSGDPKVDKADFINQGMAAMNGRNDAFVRWQDQMSGDLSMTDYLAQLEKFYLLSKPANDPDAPEITPEVLTNAYLSVMASFGMDQYDTEYAKLFGANGHFAKDYYQGRLFERDGMTKLPLFYSLMNKMIRYSQINPDVEGPVHEALNYANKFNAMQPFVFEPTPTVKNSVTRLYGERAHDRINRVAVLFSYLENLSDRVVDASALAPGLTRDTYVEGEKTFTWYQAGSKNLVDPTKLRDARTMINSFIQRTGDFFGTHDKVLMP